MEILFLPLNKQPPPQITGPSSCINPTTKTNLILTSCLAISELKALIHLFAFHIYCCLGFITGS